MAVKKITANQNKAIAALVEGKTREQAAIIAGVNERTIYKWQNDAAFIEALRAAETQALNNAQAALIARINENIAILDEIKNNRRSSDNARIRAIQLELDTMLQWRNAAMLEERINEIEERLGELAK
jgi:transposase